MRRLVECETRVETNIEDNIKRGLMASNAFSRRVFRKSDYTSDHIHKTNSVGGPHRPEVGDLGVCEKEAPRSIYFTPGYMAFVCPCKHRILHKLWHMSTCESPGFVHQGIFESYDVAPSTLIYDNVRVLKLNLYINTC